MSMNLKKPRFLIFVDDSYMLDYELGNRDGDKEVYKQEGVVPLRCDQNQLPAYCSQFDPDKSDDPDKPEQWQLYVYESSCQKYIIPSPASVKYLIDSKNMAIINLLEFLGARSAEYLSTESVKTKQTNSTAGGVDVDSKWGGVNGEYSSKTSLEAVKRNATKLSINKLKGELQPLEKIQEFAVKYDLIRIPFFEQLIYRLENKIKPSGTFTLEFTYFESYNKAVDTAANLELKVPAFSVGAKMNKSKSYNKEIEKEVKMKVTFECD